MNCWTKQSLNLSVIAQCNVSSPNLKGRNNFLNISSQSFSRKESLIHKGSPSDDTKNKYHKQVCTYSISINSWSIIFSNYSSLFLLFQLLTWNLYCQGTTYKDSNKGLEIINASLDMEEIHIENNHQSKIKNTKKTPVNSYLLKVYKFMDLDLLKDGVSFITLIKLNVNF